MLILGLDIGATTSRAVLANRHGNRLGSGTADGGNPTAHDAAAAVAAIESALRGALHGHRPGDVAAAVIGLAGIGRLAEPAVRDRFDAMWGRVGLRCPYRAVDDGLVAFAAGTASADGTLLLAGTGAIAVQIRDREIRRHADGHGWLLGDLGSGFWLGREAVRATLAHLDGWAGSGPLVRRILVDLLGSGDLAPGRHAVHRVVNAVRRDPPVGLARFARAVDETAADGDPVARDIVSRAAGHLIGSARLVRSGETGTGGPLVLAGGLLSADTVLAAEVSAAASREWPGATLAVARDGAAGAAWLAARDLPLDLTPEDLHRRLVRG